MTAFRSVVLDVDSTVSAIEGIDWLAEQRDATTARAVAALTADAMEARVSLDDVYQRRLEIIAPTRAEIAALSQAYITAALPGVREAITSWRRAGVHVLLVSGGLRDAILPLAAWLGIDASDLHAVDVVYAADGTVTHGRSLFTRNWRFPPTRDKPRNQSRRLLSPLRKKSDALPLLRLTEGRFQTIA